MRPFAHGLVFLIVAWVILILLAPVAFASGSAALAIPAAVVYEFSSRVCHQIDRRSFHIGIVQLPVCARCTGLYVSGAAGAIAGLWAASTLPGARARFVLFLAALPTALSWGLEFAGLVHPPNIVRAVAALPLGFAAAWLVISALCDEPCGRSPSEKG